MWGTVELHGSLAASQNETIKTEIYLNGLEDERAEIQVRSEITTLNHSQL